MKILSIGTGRDYEEFNRLHCAGKISCDEPIEIFHVDKLYGDYTKYLKHSLLSPKDIFEFLEKYSEKDICEIYAQRIFEHIPIDRIHYLLYLLYSVSKPGATLFITVPDFEKVMQKVTLMDAEKQTAQQFSRDLICVTTEMFNEPSDPHRSVWTPNLAKYYIELEKYWKISQIQYVSLDGRDWYMQIEAHKINN